MKQPYIRSRYLELQEHIDWEMVDTLEKAFQLDKQRIEERIRRKLP